jgi:C_GCAxxG_C_C family probable redox protein
VSKAEQAVAAFEEGANCAQAMLSTYGPALGLDADVAMRIGAPLGGGLARLGRTCGAVTGAIILIGLLHSRARASSSNGRHSVYDVAATFVQEFEARSGSTLCRELLGCDLATEAGRRRADEEGLHSKVCPNLVRDAAQLFEQLAREFEEAAGE